MKYELDRLRGIDEYFTYELNRNPKDRDIDNFTIEDAMNDVNGFIHRHVNVINIAEELGIGYRRWENGN